MGLKSVAKGIFGDVYFLPAIKNAADDFASKDTSVFGKLLYIIQIGKEQNSS